jgi:hypothetical protein
LSRKHRDRDDVFAVLRFDPGAGEVEDRITVKEIVWEEELAAAEVARLNRLNEPVGSRYFWQPTRLFRPGTSAGHSTDESSRPAS